MKTFTFTINDKLGLHARPAGELVKKAKEFKSEITLEKEGKSVNATKLFGVMGMNVKHGETVKITVDGDDEETAVQAMEKFFVENL